MDRDRRNLLERLDRYFDAVPRSATRTEEIGPFTLFVNQGEGWRYYARPRPGEEHFGVDDVRAVVTRQQGLEQPRRFEWIDDLAPGVRTSTSEAGMALEDRPLMVLRAEDFSPVAAPGGAEIRVVGPDDDLATATAVAMIGFAAPGTEIGSPGAEGLSEVASRLDARSTEFTRGRLAAGLTTMVVAMMDGVAVASGSHQPTGGVTEVTGVACLPAYRRRGLGAAVTSALVADAQARGIDLVCLSAGDGEIARVYARVGFHEVGRVGEAGPSPD